MEDRVAIRRSLHERASGETSGSSRAIVYDERNAQLLLHALGNQPHDDVGGAAGGKADQPADRLRRVRVRGPDAASQGDRTDAGDEFTPPHAECDGTCSSASSSVS